MNKFRQTILLDNNQFNQIGYWEIPILALPGIKAAGLYINGHELPSNQYSVNKNHLNLSAAAPKINLNTRAELIIEFSSSSKAITFWLPVILAIIGLLGTITQPILHSLNVLYKPSRILHIDNTAYSYVPNKLEGEISIYPIKEHLFRSGGFISEDEVNNWDLWVAATISSNVTDPINQEYRYFSGPFQLQVGDNQPFDVYTDSAFTAAVTNRHEEGIFRIIALVKKGTLINSKIFKPSEIPGIKIIGRSYYYPCEEMKYK